METPLPEPTQPEDILEEEPVTEEPILGTGDAEVISGDVIPTEVTSGEIVSPEPTPPETQGNSGNNDLNPALINYHPAASGSDFNAYEDLEAVLSEEQKNKEDEEDAIEIRRQTIQDQEQKWGEDRR